MGTTPPLPIPQQAHYQYASSIDSVDLPNHLDTRPTEKTPARSMTLHCRTTTPYERAVPLPPGVRNLPPRAQIRLELKGQTQPPVAHMIRCYRDRLSNLFPVQNHLAALTLCHDFETFLKIVNGHPMGNHPAQVNSGLCQDSHLIPGLKHFSAVDTF